MSQAVITIPADRIEWGPIKQTADRGCYQTGVVFQHGKHVCTVSVTWPHPTPQVPVVCRWDPRHAGQRD